MPFLVKDFVDVMEKIAPKVLKEDWDNVGLMVGGENQEITSILASLDCTIEVIDEAIDKGCNLIFTHHPLIFSSISKINEREILGKKILKLIKNNICVYSSHTNLDFTNGGINELFCVSLGYKDAKIMSDDSNNGFGRICTLETGISLKHLCSDICEKLQIKNVRYVGNENADIYKPSFINGSGGDFFKIAYEYGSDCIVTGDTKYHLVNDYRELGVSIIDVGHFDTEWIPFKLFCTELNKKLREKNINEIMISTEIKSPYNYFNK